MLERIIARIEKEAEEEAKKRIDKARKEGEDSLTHARKKIEREIEALRRAGKKQIKELRNRLLSVGRIEARRKILRAKEELIDKCMQKGMVALSKLPKKEYKKFLVRRIEEGISSLGRGVEVIPANSAAQVVNELGIKGIKVGEPIDSSGGVLIKSKDSKVCIDYTFEAIMERKREQLRKEIAEALFG